MTTQAKDDEDEQFMDRTMRNIDEMKGRKTKKNILKLKKDLVQITKELDSNKQAQENVFDIESVLPIEIIKTNPKFQHLQEKAIPAQEKYLKILEMKM